ncbi:MAG: transcriptional repressor [Deltaproteobacteria bacterium]|nr:transcriptional repressor [Deltaproteobacteria bacterium]
MAISTEELYQKLNDYVSKNNLKSTKQRDLIVETFFEQKGKHILIEELLEKVRQKKASIGYATVYRTLMLLVDAGIAHQRQFNDGQSRFEINSQEHHDHLICTECNRIIEFENDTIEKLQEKIAANHRFELTGHKLELYGTCPDCQK